MKPCGYPEMDLQEAQEEGRFIRFFEQAFDWNLMTYLFYPYFWGRKCTWADKLKEESNDLLFRQFLAAGSARVLVPIRDGFFDLVQYFLATGEIWGVGGLPPLPDDPHYVSMAQEIKEQTGNYYADRAGTLDVVQGSSVVTLNDTDWYWTYADPFATVPVVAGVNTLHIGIDLQREIVIDCKVYSIVSIQPNPAVTTPTSWLVTLERPYEGDSAPRLPWSTGAVFVGARLVHSDWVSLQMYDDQATSFYASTLKRDWRQALEAKTVALLQAIRAANRAAGLPSANLAAQAEAIIVVNQHHFLAGRRSFRIGYDAALGAYYVETAALERSSLCEYSLVERTGVLREAIVSLWTHLVCNVQVAQYAGPAYAGKPDEAHLAKYVTAGYSRRDDCVFRAAQHRRFSEVVKLPWFAAVLARHPGLIRDVHL